MIIEQGEIDHDGHTYRVTLVASDIDPRHEYDTYSDEVLRAWKNGEWRLVTLIVTPIVDGQPIDEAAAVVGAVEYGSLPGAEPLDLARIIEIHVVIDGGLADEARNNLDGLEATITPSACRHCGVEMREHGQTWTKAAGWHVWTAPTQQQILEYMRARRRRKGG